MDNIEIIARQHFELMPEFPHLALSHIALAIQGDDEALNRGDLKSFLEWTLSQPGASEEWGSTTSWLRFICPRRYDHTKPSRDFTIIRRHFVAAQSVIDRIQKKAKRKETIFLDASSFTPVTAQKKLKASLQVSQDILSKLDESGFEVRFFYEADKDGKTNPPTTNEDLYLAIRPVYSMGKVISIEIGEGEDGKYSHPLIESLKEIEMASIDETISTRELTKLPEAKYHIILDYPIPAKANDEDILAWSEKFATAVCTAIVNG